MIHAYVNKTLCMPHYSLRWIILHLFSLPVIIFSWMLNFQIADDIKMQPTFSQYQPPDMLPQIHCQST